MANSPPRFLILPAYQPIVRQLGLDGDAIFTDSRIIPWRTLLDRENCTLNLTLPDSRPIRWHIKRYQPAAGSITPAQQEAQGIQLLQQADIPTVPLVGWGILADGRSFLITEDLADHQPADKLLEQGFDFDKMLLPLAGLAARLHRQNLHHRDLYLCHFFINPQQPAELRLIDAARVRPLPRWPLRRRWIVKDLAQLWYSLSQAQVQQYQSLALINEYIHQTGRGSGTKLLRSIEKKAARIARHDVKLRRQQPNRNISIPT